MRLQDRRQAAVWASGATIIVLMIAASVTIAANTGRDSTAETQCQVVTTMNETRGDATSPVTVGPGPTTVVLGDSYAQGAGLDNPRLQSWPHPYGIRTGRTVWVDALGGTGFTNGGFCGGQDFATRVDNVVAHRPTTVIVQGGLNDTFSSPGEVNQAADDLLGALRTVPKVVVVGPTAAPAYQVGRVRTVDSILAAATQRAGRQYVSALGWTFPLVSDRIHPNAVGQDQYARMLAAVSP